MICIRWVALWMVLIKEFFMERMRLKRSMPGLRIKRLIAVKKRYYMWMKICKAKSTMIMKEASGSLSHLIAKISPKMFEEITRLRS